MTKPLGRRCWIRSSAVGLWSAPPREGVWIHPEAEFDIDLYDFEKSAARYEVWKKSLMDRFGYKTHQALFKGMKSCSAERRGGLITLTPMHHEQLVVWGRTKGDGIENVVIPLRARLLKLALHCDWHSADALNNRSAAATQSAQLAR